MLSRHFLTVPTLCLLANFALAESQKNHIVVRADLCSLSDTTTQCEKKIFPAQISISKGTRIGAQSVGDLKSKKDAPKTLDLPEITCGNQDGVIILTQKDGRRIRLSAQNFPPHTKLKNLKSYDKNLESFIAYQLGIFCCKNSEIQGDYCSQIRPLSGSSHRRDREIGAPPELNKIRPQK